MNNYNPLLDFDDFPRFNEIRPEHVVPALDNVLDHNRKEVDALTADAGTPDWINFMLPLEELSDQLDRMWAPVSHLNKVLDSDELRQVYEQCLPKLTEYTSDMGQNRALYDKFLEIRNSPDFNNLDNEQKTTIENELRDFRLSGIDLEQEKKQQYKDISISLSDLGNKFSRNLLDATDAWELHVTDEEDLEGLPSAAVEKARNRAETSAKPGWIFTLHAPSYLPFITFASNRSLRKKMYTAYVTRASDLGPDAGKWDNSELIVEILENRRELSNLLGYEDYAELSLQTKMAKTADEITGFLLDLANHSKDAALVELQELREFARKNYDMDTLEPWDFTWVSEKLKMKKYDIDQESLRPYFPLPGVLDGMFKIVNRLFGISISETVLKQSWHDDVQLFEVLDQNNKCRGYFYIDLFAREHKSGGAWMAECVGRRIRDGQVQKPVAFLTCNFAQPTKDKPSLLTHEEVMTLFHEFGHGLHHLLTRVNVASVAGINGVPWDAVELPSQFLENWCWDRESLNLISGHYQTGQPIPGHMLKKLNAAKNFQSALQMLRQIEFSLFDLNIHLKNSNTSDIASVRGILQQVRDQVSVVDVAEFNRFENSFSHIFAGGYAAGYYSYKWAEVLSADAFSRFEEEGVFNPETGKSFLECVLEKGGSEEPMKLFREFRGRNPEVTALLRHSGLS